MTALPPVRRLSRSVAGKVVLVTGAGSGMGRATAHVFAAEGARVACTDLGGAAERTAAEITAEGGEAIGFDLDVADPAAITAGVARVAERFGGLDILINNAGISAFKPIDDPEYDATWDRALSILLTAHQRMVRAALPHLLRSGEGRIVNIASTEGLGATPLDSPYVAAKHGVIGLTRALAVELGQRGVTVNCICPGPIRPA
jgi:3-oxoacyl-[acyl-carrier protein] reductase